VSDGNGGNRTEDGRQKDVVIVKPGDRRTFDDVLTCSTPEAVDETNPQVVELWKRRAIGIAKQYSWNQYQERPPLDLEFGRVDVLITGDPAQVEAFQPGDGCATCIEGNEIAVKYLQENPEASVTLVNLEVTECW